MVSDLSDELEALEARGPARFDVWLRGLQGTTAILGGVHGAGVFEEDRAQMGGQLVVPPEQAEVETLVEGLMRELARGAEIPLW